MSTISNLGNRWSNLYTGGQQNDSKANALQKTQSSTPSALSSNALDLSKRVAAVGSATVDFAQNFVSSFTQALFGDDAKGATIDFDSASLDVSSGYAAGVQQTRDANGVSTAAAFSLTDSSHFVGKGTITTADGRQFDFEVEVQYNYELDVAASQTSNASSADQSSDDASTADLPTVQVPNIDFPGTLADLFQLIGRNLQTALSSNDSSNQNNQTSDGIDNNALRTLSLRLLSLVDSKDSNTYSPPTLADKAKAAAATGTDEQAASTTPAASDAAAAADTVQDVADTTSTTATAPAGQNSAT